MLDPKVSALLRAKRFVEPPPAYFDQLLSDVRRRQRTELLRRPLWQIAVERAQVFFSEHSMGNLSYAGAMAAVMAVGVAAIGLLTPGNLAPLAPALAETKSPSVPASAVAPVAAAANRMLVLGPQSSTSLFPLLEARRAATPEIAAPRYIIDARPVSYERASSF